MKSAIIVIDVQQGLCSGPQAAHDCEGVISRINTVTSKAREARQMVVFVQHEAADELVYASADWQLAKGLETDSTDIFIRKKTPDSFLGTQLLAEIKSGDIDCLLICGMHTEFCVDTTARRALALGYPVALVSDAHTSAGNNAIKAADVIAHHNITLSNISSFGPRVKLVTSDSWSAG